MGGRGVSLPPEELNTRLSSLSPGLSEQSQPFADDGTIRLGDGELLADAVAAPEAYGVGAMTIMHTDVGMIDEHLDFALDVSPGIFVASAQSGDYVDGDWFFPICPPTRWHPHESVTVLGRAVNTGTASGVDPKMESVTILRPSFPAPGKLAFSIDQQMDADAGFIPGDSNIGKDRSIPQRTKRRNPAALG